MRFRIHLVKHFPTPFSIPPPNYKPPAYGPIGIFRYFTSHSKLQGIAKSDKSKRKARVRAVNSTTALTNKTSSLI